MENCANKQVVLEPEKNELTPSLPLAPFWFLQTSETWMRKLKFLGLSYTTKEGCQPLGVIKLGVRASSLIDCITKLTGRKSIIFYPYNSRN